MCSVLQTQPIKTHTVYRLYLVCIYIHYVPDCNIFILPDMLILSAAIEQLYCRILSVEGSRDCKKEIWYICAGEFMCTIHLIPTYLLSVSKPACCDSEDGDTAYKQSVEHMYSEEGSYINSYS